MSGELSISDLRTLGRERPALLDATLALIDGAEELRDDHARDCGCDQPGDPAVCAWPIPDGQLLARFDFDEEEIPW